MRPLPAIDTAITGLRPGTETTVTGSQVRAIISRFRAGTMVAVTVIAAATTMISAIDTDTETAGVTTAVAMDIEVMGVAMMEAGVTAIAISAVAAETAAMVAERLPR